MGIIKSISNNDDSGSFAASFRRKRFEHFLALTKQVSRPLKILDVGGTKAFWEQMDFADEEGIEITILNNQAVELERGSSDALKTVFKEQIGDARSMPEIADDEFDIVFSNSVIEHVGNLGEQQRMMDEVIRVGRRFFVQTPNYHFPLEPHFHVIGFQFLPFRVRVFLVQHFNLGWTEKVPERQLAENVVSAVNLLSRRQFQSMAPQAKMYFEKCFGLTKSFILYGGW